MHVVYLYFTPFFIEIEEQEEKSNAKIFMNWINNWIKGFAKKLKSDIMGTENAREYFEISILIREYMYFRFYTIYIYIYNFIYLNQSIYNFIYLNQSEYNNRRVV